jgi:hypothetical protein
MIFRLELEPALCKNCARYFGICDISTNMTSQM